MYVLTAVQSYVCKAGSFPFIAPFGFFLIFCSLDTPLGRGWVGLHIYCLTVDFPSPHLVLCSLSHVLLLVLKSPSWFLFGFCFSAAPGSAPGSQYGTMTRQISRHNSTTSSASSGGFRRNPSVTAPFSAQPHVNGGPLYSQNSSKLLGCASAHRNPGKALQRVKVTGFDSVTKNISNTYG